MKRCIMFLCLMVGMMGYAALENNGGFTISDVEAISQLPWSRTVIVKYNITPPAGVQADLGKALKLEVVASNGHDRIYISDKSIFYALSGYSGEQTFSWNPTVDHPNMVFEDVTFHIAVAATNVQASYLTVRLNDGMVRYHDIGYADMINTVMDCRRQMLAFRYIPATTSDEWKALSGGKETFTFGAPKQDAAYLYKGAADIIKEQPREIKLTHGFYLGVYPLTWSQAQWLGYKWNASASTWYGEVTQASNLSYEYLRGKDGCNSTYNYPASKEVDPTSLIGKLRTLSGLKIDLPTDAQWEYACKAGCTNAYWFMATDTLPSSNQLYSAVQTFNTGTKSPNKWGIYDMVGCIHQWTLTLGRTTDDGNLNNESNHNFVIYTDGEADPTGPTPTYNVPWRITRGSHFSTAYEQMQTMWDGQNRRIQWRVYRTAYRYPQKAIGSSENKLCGARFCITCE